MCIDIFISNYMYKKIITATFTKLSTSGFIIPTHSAGIPIVESSASVLHALYGPVLCAMICPILSDASLL